MAASDFLQLPSGTDLSIGTNTTSAPPWYQAYQQALLAKGSAIAGEAYQPYTGARIAGFTPDTLAGWDRVRSTVGQGADMATDGANLISGAAGMSGVGAADPFYNAAVGKSASAAAQPYLNAATGQSVGDSVRGALEASTKPWLAASSDYLNDYTHGAVNRMAQLGSRNLTENILPGVNATFTGAGQFGSSRNFDFNSRAIRDTQDAITGSAATMYDKAYGDAAGIYGADQNRAIDAVSKYGGLKSGDLDRILQGAGISANATSADATLLGQIGTARGQLGAGDADRQITAGSALGAAGRNIQGMNLTDAAALEGIGNNIQGQQQQSLDLGYQDFTNQKNYPLQQLQILQSLINGQPIPGSGSTTTQATPTPQTSGLAQLLALITSGAALQPRT